MTSPAALQKLVTWLSPAFPVGSFAWSAGLETAIADRRITDSISLQSWIEAALLHGGIRTDAIVLAEAHRIVRSGIEAAADAVGTVLPAGDASAMLRDLADLSLALVSSHERWMETTITGDSFVRAAAHWPTETLAQLPQPCPYPLAVGAIAAAHDIDLVDTLLAWLTATVHGQVSVAVRLVPLGQTDGLRVMSALEPLVAERAAAAAASTLADLGAIAYAADIAQMRHETLEPRIFRS